MVFTYTASENPELVRAWVDKIHRHKPKHPFEPITVVVPNMDMARWLQLQLADATGISGNIRFVLPAAWLREKFEIIDPTAKQLLLDKSHLQWMIYTLLEEGGRDCAWSHLHSWVDRIVSKSNAEATFNLGNATGGLDVESKDGIAAGLSDKGISRNVTNTARFANSAIAKARWDIASQLADAFDQYIMYRPDWLVMWQGDTIPAEDILGATPTGEDVHWQAALWLEITRRWPDIPNRATLLYRFLRKFKESGNARISGENHTSEEQPVLFAYGLSTLPTPTMLAFARFAHTTDIHWFVQHRNISERSHLAGLHDYSRDQRSAFQEILVREGVDEGQTNLSGVNAAELTKPTSDEKALKRIQRSVVDDVPLALDEVGIDSIRIHVCHSARREVEVLYDNLLDLFNTSDVRPGDVAIVTPDPDAYRPFVEEVFKSGGRQMAVHVAGARRGAGDVGAEVVLQALKMVGTRYKVPDVLDWLEAEPVLGKLTDNSGLRHTLHNWVLRQRIRWGIDARQLTKAGFQLSGRHTWRHGTDRLLLSWMAAEGEDVVVDELLTGSTVAGQDTGALLGRFAAVINALSDLQESSESEKTIVEWVNILREFTSEIFGDPESVREYGASVHTALLKLSKSAEILAYDKPVPFVVVRNHLESVLDTAGLGRAWRPGTITFTGMVALHQLPFRVVAILGLNDGKLPGKTPVSAFDLIPEFPRKGDRSRREADRQLFLDYLLTPSLRLHLSYTGMRQKDNKDLAPSVMLTMLEDFLAEKLSSDKHPFLQNLRIKHALQPFSQRYFVDDNPSQFSYSTKYRDLSAALNSERVSRPPLFSGHSSEVDAPTELTLADLQQFFRDPVKALLRSNPGISLDESDVPGESTEPFSFDSLTGWQVRSQVMRTWLESGKSGKSGKSGESGELGKSGESGELAYGDIETYLRRDGVLAEGQAGRTQMRILVAELQEFVRYLEDQIGQNPEFSTMEADIAITAASGQTYRISAMHPFIFNQTAWSFEAGKADNGIPSRKKVRHYLTHLVLNAQQPIQSRTVFRDGKELIFRPMRADEARLRLGNMMSVYEAGLNQPIPFFPACMQYYLDSLRKDISPLASLGELIEELSGDPGMYPKEYERELDSIWVREAFGDVPPLGMESDKELCGLVGSPKTLTDADLERYHMFSLMATHVVDVMNFDLLREAINIPNSNSETPDA